MLPVPVAGAGAGTVAVAATRGAPVTLNLALLMTPELRPVRVKVWLPLERPLRHGEGAGDDTLRVGDVGADVDDDRVDVARDALASAEAVGLEADRLARADGVVADRSLALCGRVAALTAGRVQRRRPHR